MRCQSDLIYMKIGFLLDFPPIIPVVNPYCIFIRGIGKSLHTLPNDELVSTVVN
jgi:hypothetical protein